MAVTATRRRGSGKVLGMVPRTFGQGGAVCNGNGQPAPAIRTKSGTLGLKKIFSPKAVDLMFDRAEIGGPMSNFQNQQQQVNLQVRYDEQNARYANQVLLNATAEEIFLDFSPGVVNVGNNQAILPIHTRIVMTPTSVLRLYQALGQALQNYQVVQTNPAPAPEAPKQVGDSGAPSNESSQGSGENK
jgi:hypothetical protein